ncbi:MAG: aldehyde dehydrogenase (NAD+), partial [Glaciecola sp.]
MSKKSKGTSWDLSPAPESTSHIKLKSEYGLFINGKFQKSKKGKMYNSINPANEKVIAKITESTTADVDLAVSAARKAYDNVW